MFLVKQYIPAVISKGFRQGRMRDEKVSHAVGYHCQRLCCGTGTSSACIKNLYSGGDQKNGGDKSDHRNQIRQYHTPIFPRRCAGACEELHRPGKEGFL
jgi:hypothetical protein